MRTDNFRHRRVCRIQKQSRRFPYILVIHKCDSPISLVCLPLGVCFHSLLPDRLHLTICYCFVIQKSIDNTIEKISMFYYDFPRSKQSNPSEHMLSMKQTKENITMKNLDEKDLKKVNGGADGFELHRSLRHKEPLFILPYPVQRPLLHPPMPVLRNMCQTSAHPEV